MSGPESAHWGVGTPHTPLQEHPPYQPCIPVIQSDIIPDRACPGLMYQPIHSTDDKLVNPKSSRFRHNSGWRQDWISRFSITSQQIIVGHSEAGRVGENWVKSDPIIFEIWCISNASNSLCTLCRSHEAWLFRRLSEIWVGFDGMGGDWATWEGSCKCCSTVGRKTVNLFCG